MSDQFSEIKSMICASSSSSVTSGFIVRDGIGDATSTFSDITSHDSDFAIPPPNSTAPDTVSHLTTGAVQMTAHDHSAPEKQSGQSSFYTFPYFPPKRFSFRIVFYLQMSLLFQFLI